MSDASRMKIDFRSLSARLQGEVHTDALQRAMLATDGSIFSVTPAAAVYPRSAADVQQTVRFAADHGIPASDVVVDPLGDPIEPDTPPRLTAEQNAVLAFMAPLLGQGFKAVLLAGNVQGVTEVKIDAMDAPAPAEDVQYYTIEKGDSLWKIASHFYGNGADYTKLFEANRGENRLGDEHPFREMPDPRFVEYRWRTAERVVDGTDDAFDLRVAGDLPPLMQDVTFLTMGKWGTGATYLANHVPATGTRFQPLVANNPSWVSFIATIRWATAW